VQAYADVSDLAAHQVKLAEGDALQGQIWAAAAAACRRSEAGSGAGVIMLPALNAMIDITTTRLVASLNHPPTIIFVLLAALSLVSAALVGYDTSGTMRRSWFHVMILAAAMSVTFYVILDLEHPRLGLIRVDGADQVLRDVGKMPPLGPGVCRGACRRRAPRRPEYLHLSRGDRGSADG
jgi:hypothetical protein